MQPGGSVAEVLLAGFIICAAVLPVPRPPFENAREDIFVLQDQISAQVMAAAEPRLLAAELERSRGRSTDAPRA